MWLSASGLREGRLRESRKSFQCDGIILVRKEEGRNMPGTFVYLLGSQEDNIGGPKSSSGDQEPVQDAEAGRTGGLTYKK